MNNRFLDIEFAISKDLTIYIFQVREITTKSKWSGTVTEGVNTSINVIQSTINKKFRQSRQKCNSRINDSNLYAVVF